MFGEDEDGAKPIVYIGTMIYGRTRESDYMLFGLVTCGNSGDRMCGQRASVGSKVQYCGVQTSTGAGQSEDCYSIHNDQLEPLVIGKIVGLLNTPDIKGQIQSEAACAYSLVLQATLTTLVRVAWSLAMLSSVLAC